MNFSFRTGFRESAGVANLIQVSGRVSRGGEHSEAVVWDFRLVCDAMLREHPGFRIPRSVLARLFDQGAIGSLSPSDLTKEAMRLEVTDRFEDRACALQDAEETFEYPTVSKLCRVIEADTRTVLIDPELARALLRKEQVDRRRLILYSVQMWTDKLTKLPTHLLVGEPNDPQALYAWDAPYDPDFLGYMAGAIPMLEGLRDGIFVA